jgi:hypothetical protein
MQRFFQKFSETSMYFSLILTPQSIISKEALEKPRPRRMDRHCRKGFRWVGLRKSSFSRSSTRELAGSMAIVISQKMKRKADGPVVQDISSKNYRHIILEYQYGEPPAEQLASPACAGIARKTAKFEVLMAPSATNQQPTKQDQKTYNHKQRLITRQN